MYLIQSNIRRKIKKVPNKGCLIAILTKYAETGNKICDSVLKTSFKTEQKLYQTWH